MLLGLPQGKSRAREWGQGCGSQLVHACQETEITQYLLQCGAEAAMGPRGQDGLVKSLVGRRGWGYSSPALSPPLVPIYPILQSQVICRSSCWLCGKNFGNSSEKKTVPEVVIGAQALSPSLSPMLQLCPLWLWLQAIIIYYGYLFIHSTSQHLWTICCLWKICLLIQPCKQQASLNAYYSFISLFTHLF